MNLSAPQIEARTEPPDVTARYLGVQAQGSRRAFAYLIHLVVPVLLLVDVLHAYRLRMTLHSDLVLGGFAAVWVISGILAYSLSSDRPRFLERAARPLVSFYTVLVMLCVFELGLVLARREHPPAV